MSDVPSGGPGITDVTVDVQKIEDLYRVLHPVMRAICSTIGAHCEVVLHDLSSRSMDRTIYAIENGHVTGREPGGPSTNLGLGVLQDETLEHNAFGYRGRTSGGRDLWCSSVYYRNASGAVIAALCINLDLTPLQGAQSALETLLPDVVPEDLPREIVGPDIQSVLAEMIDRAVSLGGKPVSVMSRSDRIEVLRNLEERGAFHIKRAVDQVAARLGVSRVTIYADLDTVRKRGRRTT